jgi:hypothetical protein
MPDSLLADNEVRRRAIHLIIQKWGTLRGLPPAVIPIVWVTVYRAVETGMHVEAAGGPSAVVKDMLIGGGGQYQELREATNKLKYLERIVPMLRGSTRRGDAQLTIDLLKWNIVDAANMSFLSRAFARLRATPDPAYKDRVPPEIYA